MSDLRFRQIHLDFHTSEHIEDIALNFDREEFVTTLERANVDSITCFARCHHGWLYYPSKKYAGMIHPNLVNKNLLLEQIEACHEKGIKAPIYTTVQWDGKVSREHKEWLSVDENGEFINTQGVPDPHFYYTICLNSGYRQFFKDHLQDIIDVVGADQIDGLFMDILFKVDCNCDHCKAKMNELGMNTNSKEERLKYSVHMLEEFKTEITRFIKERVPNGTIFYNSSHVGPGSKENFKEYSHLELESLPSGGWGYDHFPATARYARTLNKDMIGMTGKFHTYWGDFHSLKNKAALEFECFHMLALGLGCSIGDQLHPKGALSKGSYDLIGHVYKTVKEKEAYVKGAKACAQIAVMTPEEFYTAEEHDLGIAPALIGAVRMLQELSYQFDIIDSTTPMDSYKLIIMPDMIRYGTKLEETMKSYIQKGGKVIGTYLSCLDIESDSDKKDNIYGVKYQGESQYSRDFIMPNDVIGKSLYQEEYVMYGKGFDVVPTDANVLMDTMQPYFEREGDTFCSHQHAPSKGIIGSPEVTRKDDVIYFSHPVFTLYRKNAPAWVKAIVKDAIELLLPQKLICHNGPSTVITALNHQEREKRDILHLLHYITEKRSQDIYTIEDIIPLHEVAVKVLVLDKEPVSVQSVPSLIEISFKKVGDYIEFTIEKIQGYETINIQY